MNFPYIAQQTSISEKQVKNTIQLFEEGATLPFISRYRKEATGGLDEVQITPSNDRRRPEVRVLPDISRKWDRCRGTA